MLNKTGSDAESSKSFDVSGLVGLLASEAVAPPKDLCERLLRRRAPVGITLAGRTVSFTLEEATPDNAALAVPVHVGEAVCLLHLPSDMIRWLQQPLDFPGSVADEDPLQRALLLELACLDFLGVLEAQLGEPVRFGDRTRGKPPLAVDVRILAGEETFTCQLGLTKPLAEKLADALDRLQPPEPPDLAAIPAEMVVQAGSQELSLAEIESLRPGDIVVLDAAKPSAVVDGKLAAFLRGQPGGFTLSGPFAPVAERAAPDDHAEDLLQISFEFGRIGMTLAEIEKLSPGGRLPVALNDEAGVDVVSDGKRIGRGELIRIGEGMGVRIIHLSTAAGIAHEQVS